MHLAQATGPFEGMPTPLRIAIGIVVVGAMLVGILGMIRGMRRNEQLRAMPVRGDDAMHEEAPLSHPRVPAEADASPPRPREDVGMTDLDDAFVQAAKQTAIELSREGGHVLVRGTDPAMSGDAELDVLVGGALVGHIVPVGDGYGAVPSPLDGEAPSEQPTLEAALDDLGV